MFNVSTPADKSFHSRVKLAKISTSCAHDGRKSSQLSRGAGVVVGGGYEGVGKGGCEGVGKGECEGVGKGGCEEVEKGECEGVRERRASETKSEEI